MYGVLIKSPPESGLEVHPNRFRLSAPRDRFQTREAPGTENDTFREGMCKHKLSLPSFCIHMPLFSAIFSHHENTKHQQHVRQWCLIWMHCWVLNHPASVISSETGETWSTDFCHFCLIGQEVTVLKQLSLVNYTGSSCFLLKTQSTSIQLENIKEHTGYLNLFWFPNVPAFKKCKFKQTSWFLVTFAFPSSWIIKPLGFEAHLQFEL